jgi:hypothetical protein
LFKNFCEFFPACKNSIKPGLPAAGTKKVSIFYEKPHSRPYFGISRQKHCPPGCQHP